LLAVQIGVSEDQLLVLDWLVSLRDLSPPLSLGPESSFEQFVFVLLQLLEERWPHLQVLPPRVEEFESLEHAPSEPPHHVGRDNEASSILRLLTLDENTLMVFKCFLHKVEYLVGDLLSLVKQNLFLIVLPVEGEVLDPDAVPVVGELHSRGVHDAGHFVGYYKFEVLGSVFVADKKTVFDLDHADKIVFFRLVLLLGHL